MSVVTNGQRTKRGRGLNFAFLAIPILLKHCRCSCTIFSFRSLGNPSGGNQPFQIRKIQALVFPFCQKVKYQNIPILTNFDNTLNYNAAYFVVRSRYEQRFFLQHNKSSRQYLGYRFGMEAYRVVLDDIFNVADEGGTSLRPSPFRQDYE